jgi:hypothetical protein
MIGESHIGNVDLTVHLSIIPLRLLAEAFLNVGLVRDLLQLE